MADHADHDGWMLYGASGYTGVLLAEEASRRGLRPLLAGRSEAKLRPLAERLGMPFRAVGLDDAARKRARTFVWARARNSGAVKEAWLECPDGYDFTAHSALNAVRAVLDRAPSGATTPALAFGA